MEVNFVFQVRTFHRFKREVKLSANAQALWLELFGLFNERRFPDNMPVSTTSLTAMLNISKDGVIRARKELIKNGLLEEVGERRGRQHTTYRIKYFTVAPVQMAMEPSAQPAQEPSVDKPVEKQLENDGGDECMGFCDAYFDTTCDANHGDDFAAQETTQLATQRDHYDANIDANCDTKPVCDATCVDICDTYINYKRVFKLKRKSNGKPKRSLGYIKKSSPTAAGTDMRATREGELCYNSAWKTDARARARTAQNVIDALGSRRLEDNLNETICRYFQMGLAPEQALEALRHAGDVPANDALNEAAFRLGVYSAAKEMGMIDVEPDMLHAHRGNLEEARNWAEYTRRKALRDKIFSLLPGFREYLLERRDVNGRMIPVRLDKNQSVEDAINRRIDLGKDIVSILHDIRRTEEYRAYEDEQKLAR